MLPHKYKHLNVLNVSKENLIVNVKLFNAGKCCAMVRTSTVCVDLHGGKLIEGKGTTLVNTPEITNTFSGFMESTTEYRSSL